MKKIWLQNTLALSAIVGLLALLGCTTTRAPVENQYLGTPANVTITVVGRTMTVSWNAINGAQSYEIYTTSVGCGSGNRIINTKGNTATGHDGTGNYIKSDKSNGAVEIKSATNIEITLMPAMGAGNENVPMASSVTAKVKALGGKNGGILYIDSNYSEEKSYTISSGGVHDM